MGPTAAAKFAGVSVGAAKKWATGHLPHSYTGARCRIGARKPPRKEASLGTDKSTYAPPATGPLAENQRGPRIENLLLRAVLADLKAEEGGTRLRSRTGASARLGERLQAGDRPAPPLDHRFLEDIEEAPMSTGGPASPRRATATPTYATAWCASSARARGAGGTAPSGRACAAGVRASGAWPACDARGGLEVVYNKRRARGYSSYAGEGLQGAGEPREQEFPRRRSPTGCGSPTSPSSGSRAARRST